MTRPARRRLECEALYRLRSLGDRRRLAAWSCPAASVDPVRVPSAATRLHPVGPKYMRSYVFAI